MQNGQCAPLTVLPLEESVDDLVAWCLALEQMTEPKGPGLDGSLAISAWDSDGSKAPNSTTQAVSQVIQKLDLVWVRRMLLSVNASNFSSMGLDQGDP